jgi:hypothetical protein
VRESPTRSDKRHEQRVYDHRLRQLVRDTGDIRVATEIGVPRSTAAGWLRAEPQNVVTLDLLGMRETELQLEVVKLRRRILVLATVVHLLLALVRLSGARLDARSIPRDALAALLGTIERTRKVLQLRSILRILGLSPARYHSWLQPDADCHPADAASCPKRVPNQLTAEDVSVIKDMVTSPEYRHVPTSRLAILAQRLGRVSAAPSTWAKLVRERGWRRPRFRIHPKKPMVGLRTTRPDEAWHVDTTVLRLLDGSKAYAHAVIDNFSRRILAFRVGDHFDIGNAIAVLMDAVRNATAKGNTGAPAAPMLMVDGGVENFNAGVDELVASGQLRRVLAQTEVSFSNSLIEAFWRTMRHQWLFLNTLDSVAAVRRHMTFYVSADHDRSSAAGAQAELLLERLMGAPTMDALRAVGAVVALVAAREALLTVGIRRTSILRWPGGHSALTRFQVAAKAADGHRHPLLGYTKTELVSGALLVGRTFDGAFPATAAAPVVAAHFPGAVGLARNRYCDLDFLGVGEYELRHSISDMLGREESRHLHAPTSWVSFLVERSRSHSRVSNRNSIGSRVGTEFARTRGPKSARIRWILTLVKIKSMPYALPHRRPTCAWRNCMNCRGTRGTVFLRATVEARVHAEELCIEMGPNSPTQLTERKRFVAADIEGLVTDVANNNCHLPVRISAF